MSTFNPSKARQDWQAFKKKHPSVEKLRNYPKGIGNLLDENVKIMQLAKDASQDFSKCLDETSKDWNGVKKLEQSNLKFDQALGKVLDHLWALNKKLDEMEDLIKSSAKKDPTLKPALTDWNLFFRVKVSNPLGKHWEYVHEKRKETSKRIQNLRKDQEDRRREWEAEGVDKASENAKELVKSILGYPYKKYVTVTRFRQIMKTYEKWEKEASELGRFADYKF